MMQALWDLLSREGKANVIQGSADFATGSTNASDSVGGPLVVLGTLGP